jgi:hypothetical protein
MRHVPLSCGNWPLRSARSPGRVCRLFVFDQDELRAASGEQLLTPCSRRVPQGDVPALRPAWYSSARWRDRTGPRH